MLRIGFVFGSSALLVSALLAGACSNIADDCDVTSTCSPIGGSTSGASSSGASGNGGSPSGGSNAGDGGTSTAGASNGGAGTSGGEAGSGGDGGSIGAPCDDACTAPTPVCKEATDTCVECLAPADCTTGAEDKCDQATNTCVECIEAADCDTPAAARCEGGACVKCESNADCTHIADKAVCDTAAGECVQCTGKDYASCGSDMGTPLVCDSLLRTCSTNKKASAGLCQPCISDAECTAGKLCVMQTFGEQDDEVGYFCFWQKGATVGGAPTSCLSAAAKPYASSLAEQTSVDGTTADICGLRSSTCVARNQFSSKDCATNNAADDTKCGFAPGEDSKCLEAETSVYRCTTTCLSSDDCDNTVACNLGAAPKVCEL
jgi:hypothetical protein